MKVEVRGLIDTPPEVLNDLAAQSVMFERYGDETMHVKLDVWDLYLLVVDGAAFLTNIVLGRDPLSSEEASAVIEAVELFGMEVVT